MNIDLVTAKAWRLIKALLLSVFVLGFIAGLLVGTNLHAETLKGKPSLQKFALIILPQ